MIVVNSGYRSDAYSPNFNYYKPPHEGFGASKLQNPDFHDTDKWVAVMKTEDGGLVLEPYEYSGHVFDGLASYDLHIKADGHIGLGWVSISGGQVIKKPQGEWNDKLVFEKNGMVSVPTDYQAEIIYSGMSKGTLSLMYREYYKRGGASYSRPDYSQNLQYDINNDSLIQFKTMKIKVIKANNSGITFSVTDDGGVPWIAGASQ